MRGRVRGELVDRVDRQPSRGQETRKVLPGRLRLRGVTKGWIEGHSWGLN